MRSDVRVSEIRFFYLNRREVRNVSIYNGDPSSITRCSFLHWFCCSLAFSSQFFSISLLSFSLFSHCFLWLSLSLLYFFLIFFFISLTLFLCFFLSLWSFISFSNFTLSFSVSFVLSLSFSYLFLRYLLPITPLPISSFFLPVHL